MKEALVARLRNAAGISAICGTYNSRPAIDWIKRAPVLPSVMLRTDDIGRIYAHDSNLSLHNPQLEIHCYGKTFGEAKVLARAVVAELENEASALGIDFDEGFLIGERSQTPVKLPSGQMVYSVRLDLSLWYDGSGFLQLQAGDFLLMQDGFEVVLNG